jgi:hypothetical protein
MCYLGCVYPVVDVIVVWTLLAGFPLALRGVVNEGNGTHSRLADVDFVGRLC